MDYYEFTIEGRILLISKDIKISIIGKDNESVTCIVMFPFGNEREVYCVDQSPEEVLKIISDKEEKITVKELKKIVKSGFMVSSQFI